MLNTHRRPQRQGLRISHVCLVARARDGAFPPAVAHPPEIFRPRFLMQRNSKEPLTLTRSFMQREHVRVPAPESRTPALAASVIDLSVDSPAGNESKHMMECRNLLLRINEEKREIARSLETVVSPQSNRFPSRAIRLPLIYFATSAQRAAKDRRRANPSLGFSSGKAAIGARSPIAHSGAGHDASGGNSARPNSSVKGSRMGKKLAVLAQRHPK